MFDHSEVAEQSAGLGRCQIPDEARVDALRAIVAQTLPAKVVVDVGLLSFRPSLPIPTVLIILAPRTKLNACANSASTERNHSD